MSEVTKLKNRKYKTLEWAKRKYHELQYEDVDPDDPEYRTYPELTEIYGSYRYMVSWFE
jgi:hypothetical protein